MCSVSPRVGPSRKPLSCSPKVFGTNPNFLRLSPHETVDPWLAGYSSACHRKQSGLLLAVAYRGAREGDGSPGRSPSGSAAIPRRTPGGNARLARAARPNSRADPGRPDRLPARLAHDLLAH